VGGDILIDSETLLLTDFMNLKIKPTQSFKDAHRDNMCMRVFICVSGHTYINSYIYTMFLKKHFPSFFTTDQNYGTSQYS
jgi:hypothetical protein